MIIRPLVLATLCAILSLTALAQSTATPPPPAHPDTVHPDVIRLIDTWLEADHAFRRLPSMTVALVKGDNVVFRKGYGSVDGKDGQGKRPVTPDTIYSICSISKLFTSIAVMQLVEQGKLRLDDELNQYLPEFKLKQADDSSGPVTIRGVLMHAAGLPRETVHDVWTGPDFPFPTRAEMLAGLPQQEMYQRSLSRFQYSNFGISLLGEIVSRVSGQPFEQYVMDHVVKPMGLTATLPRVPDELRGTGMAIGYSPLRRDGTREVMSKFDARSNVPAAGFSSTANDLATFARWQLRVLRTGKAEVLKAATLREMTRVQWTDPDGKLTWGLGYLVSRTGNDLYVGHDGYCPGYRTVVTSLPQKDLGAAVLLSSIDDPNGRARRMIELAQKVPTPPPTGEAANKAFTPANLVDYAGRYQGWSGENVIRLWGSDLVNLSLPTDNPGEAMQILRPIGVDRFRVVREDKSLADEVIFLRDATGKVAKMRLWGSVRDRRGE